jgi:hypothetical protein
VNALLGAGLLLAGIGIGWIAARVRHELRELHRIGDWVAVGLPDPDDDR